MFFEKKKILDNIDEKPPPPKLWRRHARWLPGFLIILIAVFLAFFEQYFLPIHLPEVGQPSPQAIRAPYDFIFDEGAADEKVAAQELKDFLPIYIYDAEKTRQIPARWEIFFEGVEQCRDKAATSNRNARTCLQAMFVQRLSERALSEFLRYPHAEKMYTMLLTSLKQQLTRGVLDDEQISDTMETLRVQRPGEPAVPSRIAEVSRLSEARQVLEDNLELVQISSELQKAFLQQLTGMVEANLTWDDENDERLASLKNMSSQKGTVLYRRGDLLVRRGQVVTLLDYYRVQDCFLKPAPKTLWIGAASFLPFFLITLIFVVIVERYLMSDQGPGRFTDPSPSKSYLLVFSVLFAVLLLAKVLLLFTNVSGFALPVGLAGIVVTLLLNPMAGVLTALLTSIYTTLLTNLDMGLFLYYLVESLLFVLFAARTPRRIRLLFYAVVVGLLNVLLLICITLLRDQIPDAELLREPAAFAFLSAPAAWFLAVLIIPLGENLFRLTTSDRLRDLCDLNHPLLKKLQDKAPGTYYHSLAVANLACVAAEAVKANVLLVRAGAYFHDIGKLVQPQYFIENQSNRDNPHDNMDPRISADIVKSHVTDGVSIAREHGFPSAVADLIAQHHGTTVLEMFYQKAQQDPSTEEWSRDFFRYSGPTPTTIEAGILMIADVAEAMFRVLKATNPMDVREKLHSVIAKKFEDGQFDHCALPTSTLAVAEAAMIQALLGILHKRIEYPDNKTEEEPSPA